MKINYLNKDAIMDGVKRGGFILLPLVMLVTTPGCSKEVSTNSVVNYDIIDTQNQDLVDSGIEQIIDVPGEDFKLSVSYKCLLEDGEKWTITDDKQMFMSVRTINLDPETKVYIDNIHTDTTIRSIYPSIDGIVQDSMDDRIHNSLMKGFPISDTVDYNGVNVIEGQNDSFITGSFYGFYGNSYGTSNGTVEQQRYVESDYLKRGVTGNEIRSVIDLIIDKSDGTTRCTSVQSTMGVSAWPYIENKNSLGQSEYDYYYFDKDSMKIKKTTLNKDEYEQRTNNGKTLSLKK